MHFKITFSTTSPFLANICLLAFYCTFCPLFVTVCFSDFLRTLKKWGKRRSGHVNDRITWNVDFAFPLRWSSWGVVCADILHFRLLISQRASQWLPLATLHRIVVKENYAKEEFVICEAWKSSLSRGYMTFFLSQNIFKLIDNIGMKIWTVYIGTSVAYRSQRQMWHTYSFHSEFLFL